MRIEKQLLNKIFFLLLVFFIQTQAQEDKVLKVDAFINQAMIDWKMPGFAVAIVKNDSVIFSKGYGVRDIRKSDPVNENTLFVIASCSKAFTTASLAILVDQGKIKWDDPVTKYLPDFQLYDSWVTKEITIRDLVSHKSGLETFSGDFLWINSTYDRKEVIQRARYLKNTSGFRSKYGYQNIMFIAAAEIIKAVTDTSWGDYINSHILKKIEMKNSNTSYAEFYKTINASKAHYTKDNETKVYTDHQIDNAQGALGINSSAYDVAQWIRLQLGRGSYKGKRIFSERQSAEMWNNQTSIGQMNYGLGWFIRYWNGKRMMNHGGGMPGFISDVTLIPEEKFGFVLLSNYDNGMVGAVRNYISDIFTNIEPRDWEKIMLDGYKRRMDMFDKENKRREEIRVKDSNPSLPLEKYCGIYEDKMYGKTEVSLREGKLFLQFIPSPTFRGELKHYHYDQFYIDWEDEFLTRGWVKFDMNFTAEIKKMTFEVPNSPDFIFTELLFEKLPDRK